MEGEAKNAKKRPLEEELVDLSVPETTRRKVDPFRLYREISEEEKLKIIIKNGTKNVRITVTRKDRMPMPKQQAFMLRREIDMKVPNHEEIEEMVISKNNNLIFRSSSPECLEQILNLKNISGVEVIPRIITDSVCIKYVIHDVDPETPLSEISKELERSSIDWFQLVRFTKTVNGARIPTSSVLVKEYHSTAPQKMKLWYTICSVTSYIERPRICHKCLKYGHFKAFCRGNVKCKNCGDNHDHGVCKSTNSKCFRCKGDHDALSNECPNYKDECKILQLKAEKRISYQEAKQQMDATITSKPRNTYAASVIQDKKVQDTINAKLADIIQTMTVLIQSVQQLSDKVHSMEKKESAVRENTSEKSSNCAITENDKPIEKILGNTDTSDCSSSSTDNEGDASENAKSSKHTHAPISDKNKEFFLKTNTEDKKGAGDPSNRKKKRDKKKKRKSLQKS